MSKYLVGFLVGLLVGGLAIGVGSYRHKENELASLIFMHDLFEAQSSAKTLQMLDQERLDVVRTLLQNHMDSAVDGAYRTMVSHEPELGWVGPALLDGLEDAESYLAAGNRESKTYLWLRDVTQYVRGTVE